MKTDNFSMYIDIFLPIYNPGGIPGLQNTDSSIPDTGIEKRDTGLQSLGATTSQTTDGRLMP